MFLIKPGRTLKFHTIFIVISISLALVPITGFTAPTEFVVQLTKKDDNGAHRRALMQVARVLKDVGRKNVNFTVVAYEHGITALLENNEKTAELVAGLNRLGVSFKACKVSMQASDLTEDDFPMEVDYVAAGAPELIRLRLKGYEYWRP